MKISPSQTFLCSLALFCVGIGLSKLLPYEPLLWFAAGLAPIFVITPLLSRKSFFIPLLYIFCCGLLGISRAQFHQHIPSPETIDWYASEEGTPITFSGQISAEPDIRRDKINYTISVHEPAQGKVLISTGKYPQYDYGDTLEVSGNLLIPAQFETFDYAGYLARYGIHSVMYRPYVKRSQIYNSQQGPFWQQFMSLMLRTKFRFEDAMNRTFSTEPYSSFMAGLLLGSRKGIPDQLSEDFRITGLTHIIAISGYNITLIVTILMGLFKPLGRRPSIILSAAGIILFTLFVGASAAVVRACIMGLIGLVALNSERKGQITMTLLLTATIMIAYNPLILIHDVGFQLSFLATMGLIYIAPLLNPFFRWLPEALGIRESILLTLSAQIMALPIILLNFQNLSLISPIANLLVAGPILPFTMLFGFLATMTSILSLTFAKLLAFPAFALLEYVVTVVHLVAKAPYATIEISWFDLPLLGGFFLLLTSFLIQVWGKRHHRVRRIQGFQTHFSQRLFQRLHQAC